MVFVVGVKYVVYFLRRRASSKYIGLISWAIIQEIFSTGTRAREGRAHSVCHV